VANGANTIQISAANLTAGTHTLVDYTGTIGGGGFASFTLSGLPSRAVGGMVHNTTGTSIDLNITAIDSPKWIGGINGLMGWDHPELATPCRWRTNELPES
jgi:hypothetical protein